MVVSRIATISAFDVSRGIGELQDIEGRRYPFHSTAISDGSRRIEVGEKVAFDLAAGHGGVMEAARVLKLVG